MFRNSFQGGPIVEIFNPVTKELFSNWLLSKQVTKEYDRTAKTMTCFLRGESTVQQMCIPKDKKKSLGLTQHYLVIQIYSQENQRFCVDVRVSCKSGSHHRVTFLSHKQTLQLTPLFAAVPLDFPFQPKWSHLVINFLDIVSELWHEEFKSIDFLSISGRCNVRQIYTVHENLIEQPNCKSWENRYMDFLPKKCKFPVKVPQAFHLIGKTFISLKCAKKASGGTKRDASDEDTVVDSIASYRRPQESSQSADLKLKSSGSSQFDASVDRQRSTSLPSSSTEPFRRIRVTSMPLETIAQSSAEQESSSDESSRSKVSIPDPETLRHRLSSLSMENTASSSASTDPQPSRYDTSVDISNLLPRYKQKDVWIPQLSPISDSLFHEVPTFHEEDQDLNNTKSVKSVHDLFKQYVEKETTVKKVASSLSLNPSHDDNDNTLSRATISSLPRRFKDNQFEIRVSSSDDENERIQIGLSSTLSLNPDGLSVERDIYYRNVHSDE